MRVSPVIVYFLLAFVASIFLPVNSSASDSVNEDLTVCGVSGMIRLADGANLRVRLALSEADKKQGLSGIRESDFAKDEALLMMGFETKLRVVNMGDMLFDIDVFFLDSDLKVVGLQRRLKAHPGRAEPPPIEKSAKVFSRHILEMRSDSLYATKIELGMRLKWQSQPTIKEIEECMEEISY